MAVLLFDFDGVIADTLPGEIKYFLPICKEMGLGISSAQDLKDLCNDNVFSSIQKLGISLPLYFEAYNKFYETLNKKKYIAKPYPGMIEFLKETTLKNAVYIVTSNLYKFPADMFSKYDITGIKGILSGDMESSKTKKINSIKEQYPNEKICFITDTKGDVLEARKSTADVIIAVTWGWHSKEVLETANADIMIDSVFELKEYIECFYYF